MARHRAGIRCGRRRQVQSGGCQATSGGRQASTGQPRPRLQEGRGVDAPPARALQLQQIERTVAAHEAGEEARIALKMNSLVDAGCIRALYEVASPIAGTARRAPVAVGDPVVAAAPAVLNGDWILAAGTYPSTSITAVERRKWPSVVRMRRSFAIPGRSGI